MKRFTLAAIVAAAMVVCATATARAGTYKLTPPPGSDFPHATGLVSVRIQGPFKEGYEYYYKVWLDCRVSHLAPSHAYGLVSKNGLGYREVGPILTDAKGNGTVSWMFYQPWAFLPLGSYIVVDSTTYVVELSSK
jgi:hypothetical protein